LFHVTHYSEEYITEAWEAVADAMQKRMLYSNYKWCWSI